MLKKYLLFAGENYYPVGGWEDFVGDFDTLDEAKAKAGTPRDSEWAHIVELPGGELWEYHDAVDNKTYPDWPVLPAGWFTLEEVRQRRKVHVKAAADYRKKQDDATAAERAKRSADHEKMVKRYQKQARQYREPDDNEYS